MTAKKEPDTPTTPATDDDSAPDPKATFKEWFREAMDEYTAERATDPKRTQRPDLLKALFGG